MTFVSNFFFNICIFFILGALPTMTGHIQPSLKKSLHNYTAELARLAEQDYTTNCSKSIDAELLKLRRIFLAINFNHPFYENVPTLVKFYKPLFPNYILCGPERDKSGRFSIVKIPQAKSEYGYYGYQCVVEAMHRHPGYNGYLYINDDMIINWWNFLFLDQSKIWFGESITDTESYVMGSDPTSWWRRVDCGKRCTESFGTMTKNPIFKSTDMFAIYRANTKNKNLCFNGLSDIFYVPKRYATRFKLIAQDFFDNYVFLEVAVPTTLIMLDKLSEFTILNGIYLQRKYGWGRWTKNTRRAWEEYNRELCFLHPYKLSGENKQKNTGEFEERIGKLSEILLATKCFDVLSDIRAWLKQGA